MACTNWKDARAMLAKGDRYGVFIDDTGSPGLKSTPAHLHPNRKSWVALLIPPADMPFVLEQERDVFEFLKRLGVSEFHAAEMRSREREEDESELMRGLFGALGEIFRRHRFPIIVQTMDPDGIRKIQENCKLPTQPDPFDISRHSDFALVYLLFQVKKYIRESTPAPAAPGLVIVDQCDFGKAGTRATLPWLEPIIEGGSIFFGESSSILPIQLADFAAWSMNRVQLLRGRGDLGEFDAWLLQLLSSISWNYVNLEMRPGSISRTEKGWKMTEDPPMS